MVEKQIKNWSVDLLTNHDDEFMEEVTSVAVPHSGVSEKVTCFYPILVALMTSSRQR